MTYAPQRPHHSRVSALCASALTLLAGCASGDSGGSGLGGDVTSASPATPFNPGQGSNAGGATIGTGMVTQPGGAGVAVTPTRPGSIAIVPPSTCARAELNIKRTIPTVWLLVDGSGSMSGGLGGVDLLGGGLGLGGTSRWTLLRQALMDPSTGLVPRLQASVAFGLMIYDGGASPPGIFIPGICPNLVTVDPALDNFAALNAAYPATPLGASTPTHHALVELSNRIAQRGPNPLGPTYVVLATDGKPNLCDFHDGIPASASTEQEAVTTVSHMASRGTKLFAISLAGGDRDLQSHLQQVAQAGATGQPAFDPDSKDALAAALSTIVGGTATCEARIEGSIVKGRECAGDVRLNGEVLACNSPDGFHVKPDGETLELVGAACKELQGDPTPTLKASFACEDVVLN